MNKPRKRITGEIRDKEKTKLKLIHAVGEIIKTDGYTGLGVNKIAKKAEVDKKLIYRYFDSVNGLIETYIRDKDYWISLAEKQEDILKDIEKDMGEELGKTMLKTQMSYFYDAQEMQKLIIWEISEKNKLLKEMSLQRELFGEQFFKLIEPYFQGTDVDIRSVFALQIAGVYYMVLQAKSNGTTFCGVDINQKEGMDRVMKTLDKIITLAYAQIAIENQIDVTELS